MNSPYETKALIKKTKKDAEVQKQISSQKQALNVFSLTHTPTWRQVPEIREKASALPSVNFTPSATGKACSHTHTHTHTRTHTRTHTQRFRLWTWSHSHKKCKAMCKCEPCSSCWRSGSYTGFIAHCVHSLILSSIFSRPISCSQTHPNFALSDSIKTTSKDKSGLLFF